MTGGIGFTSLMQSLSKTNRSFLKHADKVKSKIDNLTYLTDKSALRFKEISKEDLEKFKAKIIREKKAEQRKGFIIVSIKLFIILAFILFVILHFKK